MAQKARQNWGDIEIYRNNFRDIQGANFADSQGAERTNERF